MSEKYTMDEREQLVQSLVVNAEDEGRGLAQTYGLHAPNPSSSHPHFEGLGIDSLPLLSIFTEEDEPAKEAPGQVFEQLQVLSPLGTGGIGEVFLARQTSLSRRVALKRLRVEKQTTNNQQAMLREAVITGYLEHPNIIPVHLLGRDEQGQLIFVMKRVEGVSWRELLYDETHPLWETLKSAHGDALLCHLEILIEVCKALEFAHSKGVLHCDVKPENVMIGVFGEVYLLDWGIATTLPKTKSDVATKKQEEKANVVIGTPAYMAPEMVVGQAFFSERTDVYLLGATLHEILSKETKHIGKTLTEMLMSALNSLPWEYGEHIPKALATLCNRATHAQAANRQQSVKAFRQELVDFLRHRVAIELGEQANEQLAELQSTTQKNHDENIHAAVLKLYTECRFGYVQALRVWEEYPDALRGLQECLCTMLAYQLEQGHVVAAGDLLSEIVEPPASLVAQVEALQASQESQQAAYEAFVHGKDPSVSLKQRIWFVVLVTCVSVISPIVLFPTVLEHPAEARLSILLNSTSLLVSLILCAVVLRKQLLKNAFNRQFLYFALTLSFSMTLHRVLIWHHQTSVIHGLTVDILIFTCSSFFIGLLHRSFLVFSIVGSTCLIWLVIYPHQLVIIYNVLAVSCAGLFVWSSRREKRLSSN